MLRLARPLGSVPRRQILSRSLLSQTRGFAERKDTILSSDPAFAPVIPKPAPPTPEVPLGPAGPASKTPIPIIPSTGSIIPPENVPKVPPPPPSQPAATPPPPPVPVKPAVAALPPPKPKRFRTLRLFVYLLLIGALGYGGAIAFALRNDNFHDFFSEYVPFGESILLDIEERNFKKRFPNAKLNTYRATSPSKKDDEKVTIPSKSGLSWKVAEEKGSGTDLSTKGKHMSAIDSTPPTKTEVKQAQQDPKGATPKEATAAVERAKAKKEQKDSSPEKAAPKIVSTEEPKTKPSPITKKDEPAPVMPVVATPSPKSDPRPPAISPVTQISPLQIANANEPVVQELVKVVNDLITVVNSDSPDAANKYSGPMQKAKDSLAEVAGKIGALRDEERKSAEERIAQAHKEFDEGARNLLHRIETAQKEDDIRYREEFEAERAKIVQQYEARLKTELERTQQVAEQRLQNVIAEQGIEMKRNFISEIKSLVESERDGRLSQLSDLSTNVDDLTQLTSNWNGIIDSNLATQKLQVAVDAVRSALQTSTVESTPKPFVREMAALKLTAEGDPIVEAAVASINPQAYQRGIPSAAQLIDRFRRVASEVRKASLLPENAGIASHAASIVLSKVMFKKAGQPEGDDVESILTRTETMLEEGDLDSAAREMNGLKGWAGVLSRDWLGDVRKVLEVQQALDVIETEARLQCLRVE